MGGKTSTASKQKYNAKTYDRLVLNLRMDSQQSKQAIEQAAQAAGESTTAYVDRKPGGYVFILQNIPPGEKGYSRYKILSAVQF